MLAQSFSSDVALTFLLVWPLAKKSDFLYKKEASASFISTPPPRHPPAPPPRFSKRLSCLQHPALESGILKTMFKNP